MPSACRSRSGRLTQAPLHLSDFDYRTVRGLFRLRNNPKVGLRRLPPIGIFLFRFLVRYRRQDDYIVPLLPVHRGGHLMGGCQLNRIEDSQNFVKIAPGYSSDKRAST